MSDGRLRASNEEGRRGGEGEEAVRARCVRGAAGGRARGARRDVKMCAYFSRRDETRRRDVGGRIDSSLTNRAMRVRGFNSIICYNSCLLHAVWK